MNQQAHRKFQWSVIALSGIFTFAVLMLLFLWKGLAPFGTKSLVVMDANIQYLDFFLLLQGCFVGGQFHPVFF